MDRLKDPFEESKESTTLPEQIGSYKAVVVDPEKQSSEKKAACILEIQRKIDDEIKTDEIRASIGLNNGGEGVKSFLDGLPNRDGFIDFSQLKRVGHGGTHDVYIYPQTPSHVIKLNRAALKKALSIGQAELPPEVRILASEYATGENSKNEELYKHFGQRHCLREKAQIRRISIEQDGVVRDIEGIVTVQEAGDAFKNPDRIDFSTGYTERNTKLQQNKGIYDKMNLSLLSDGEFSESDFLEFNEKLKSVFKLIDLDENFANSIREFLLRFKSFFESSGRFIDLVGQENVLFYNKDGKWMFQLGSVIKGENKQVMDQAMGLLRDDPQKINQDQKIKSQLMNQLALIRLLNAVGLKVGVGKIVDIHLSKQQLSNLDAVKW